MEYHRTERCLERLALPLPSWVSGLDPSVLVCQVETPLPPTSQSSPRTGRGHSRSAGRKREPFSVTPASHFHSAGRYCQLRFLSQCLKGSHFPLPPPRRQLPIPPPPRLDVPPPGHFPHCGQSDLSQQHI